MVVEIGMGNPYLFAIYASDLFNRRLQDIAILKYSDESY